LNLVRVEYIKVNTTEQLQLAIVYDSNIYISTSAYLMLVLYDKVIVKTYANLCKNNTYPAPTPFFIINSIGNIYFVCKAEYLVYLYNVDGTNLNKYVSFVNRPVGLAVDIYGRFVTAHQLPYSGVEIVY
jgi:hypothetical protein